MCLLPGIALGSGLQVSGLPGVKAYGRPGLMAYRRDEMWSEGEFDYEISPFKRTSQSFHQPQRRKSRSIDVSYKPQHERKPETDKERPARSLKTSRGTSPWFYSAVSSSKVLAKPGRLTEKEPTEAARKWAAEEQEMSDASNMPEICEYEAGSTAPSFIYQAEEPEGNAAYGIELYEDSLTRRFKAIALKAKEIEQAYRQDCETFWRVVKMLIEKDPSLEKSIEFALRQNLQEIGERHFEELKHFMAEYDTSTQEFGDLF
ncbi:periphilin-1-like [Nycticebus coucang]|uniref:periphilin-1-like n=1 Tax=Nycticebus coucang TaxID=9470 RepID=UPI00234DA807|nr:periphilin-1-like [Nycticebus coucang]XP_053435046.1 periphilin-1-like [Nycticebus coucang]